MIEKPSFYMLIQIHGNYMLIGVGMVKNGFNALMIFGWWWSKWAWHFRSRDSKICCILRMNKSANLGKLKLTLIIIRWASSEMGEGLKIMGFLNQVYLTNDLMN